MVFVPLAISFGAASPNVTSYTVLIDGAPDVFNVGAQTIATNGPMITLTIPGSLSPFGPGQSFNIRFALGKHTT